MGNMAFANGGSTNPCTARRQVDAPKPPHPHRHHHGQPDFAPHTTTDTFQTELTDNTAITDSQPPTEPPTTPEPQPPIPASPIPSTPAATLVEHTLTETPETASTNTYTTEVCRDLIRVSFIFIACYIVFSLSDRFVL